MKTLYERTTDIIKRTKIAMGKTPAIATTKSASTTDMKLFVLTPHSR